MPLQKKAPPYYDFPEVASSATPDADHVRLYNKNGVMTQKNESGTESALGGGLTGALGSTDNALVRTDGTGGGTAQGSSVTLGDTGVISGGMQIATNASTGNKIYLGGEVSKTLDATGDVTPGNDRNITITSNSGFSDDLTGIIGGFNSGEAIYLRAASGHTITVLHDSGATAGNDIHLPNDIASIVLDEINYLRLDFAGGGHWCLNLSAGSSGAPTTATYITQTSDGTLSNEQALASLATGIMKVTTTTGVISSLGDPLPIANGGTNGATATAGFDNLAPTTTKGDLVVHNGTDNVRLAVGTDGYVPVADSSDAEGIVWELRNVSAILRDEKTSGTAGGSSSTTTWNARNLNTEVSDPYGIVSIASNQATPIAGNFIMRVWAVAGASVGLNHRLRLYNVTAAAVVDEGVNTQGAAGVRSTAHLVVAFSANGTDAYRIDHYTSTGLATSGLGIAVNDGSAEVYMEIELEKVPD